MIIDGTNAILGRLAAHAAKALLKNEEVAVVNAEKIIITGDAKGITGKYLKRRRIGSPQHGPFFPTRPELIVRRTVRGMLPYKTSRGRDAMRKLRVYAGQPPGMQNAQSSAASNQRLLIGMAKEVRTDYITVGKLAERLGWKE